MTLEATVGLDAQQRKLTEKKAQEEAESKRLIPEIYDLAASMLRERGSLKDGILTLEIPVKTKGCLGLGIGKRDLQRMVIEVIIRVNDQDDNAPYYYNDLEQQKEALQKNLFAITILGLVDEEFEREVRERKVVLNPGTETRSWLLIVPPFEAQAGQFKLNCSIKPRILHTYNRQFTGGTDAGLFRQPKLNELKSYRDVLAEYKLSMLMASNLEVMATLLNQPFSPYAPRL